MPKGTHAASLAAPAGQAQRQPAAVAAASPAPLGTLCGICNRLSSSCDCEKGDLDADRVDTRLGRYALQAVAREWLWDPAEGLAGDWHRLAGCHRWMAYRRAPGSVLPGPPHKGKRPRGLAGQAERVESVALLHDAERMRAYYAGLQTCGSAWVDPICSGVIYDYRRGEVAEALEWARENGYRVYFVTLTAQHSKGMRLATLLSQLGMAMRRVYTGSPWRLFRDATGYLGSIKGVEVTNGKHGWHPHYHLLWFSKMGTALQVRAYVDPAWRSALASVGLSGLKGIAANVKESSMTAGEYMTKFGHDRGWDLDAELTMWTRKDGLKQKSATPWDLLRAGLRHYDPATDGPVRGKIVARCRVLFREYAAATKGKHSLEWSKGLKALVGVADVSDDDAAAGELNDRELAVLALLSVAQWRRVVANDLRGELLQVANGGDVGAVAAFLALIGVYLDAVCETAAPALAEGAVAAS